MKTYTFYKEDYGGWYIGLPEYPEQGGSIGDLEMVAGGDTMLEIIAQGNNRVTITMDTKPFKGADELVLLRLCDPIIGGGYYLMSSLEGKAVNQEMWLCSVTEFVFGGMPGRIYVKREQ